MKQMNFSNARNLFALALCAVPFAVFSRSSSAQDAPPEPHVTFTIPDNLVIPSYDQHFDMPTGAEVRGINYSGQGTVKATGADHVARGKLTIRLPGSGNSIYTQDFTPEKYVSDGSTETVSLAKYGEFRNGTYAVEYYLSARLADATIYAANSNTVTHPFTVGLTLVDDTGPATPGPFDPNR